MLAETRKEPGKLPAGVFAVLVHLAFVGLLVFGVSWQNKHPAPVEAELWNKLPSAPKHAVEPPSPPPKPMMKKEVQPEPIKPKPEVKQKVAEPEKAQPKPDIALKEKLEKKKLEEEKLKAEQEKIKAAEAKKAEQDKKKKLAEQQEQEQDEVLKDLLAAQKAAKDKARASESAAANANSGLIGSFKDRIRTKIEQNTQVPPDVASGTSVVYKLVLLPSGDLLSVTLVKSSGNTAYDDAVARGIQRAAPLPLPPDSSLFSNFRELTLPFTHEK
jgi:colicin import membrane protein